MKKPIKIFLADLVHDKLPNNYVVPLNIASIAAYCEMKLGKDVKITLFKSPDKLMDSLIAEKPQV